MPIFVFTILLLKKTFTLTVYIIGSTIVDDTFNITFRLPLQLLKEFFLL